MRLKYLGLILFSLALGTIYYFVGGDRESGRDMSIFFGACNISVFVLYLYASLASCKSSSESKFKLAVFGGVFVYAAIYLLVNVEQYNDFKAKHAGPYPAGYTIFLTVAVVGFMAVVLSQAWRAWKNRENCFNKE